MQSDRAMLAQVWWMAVGLATACGGDRAQRMSSARTTEVAGAYAADGGSPTDSAASEAGASPTEDADASQGGEHEDDATAGGGGHPSESAGVSGSEGAAGAAGAAGGTPSAHGGDPGASAGSPATGGSGPSADAGVMEPVNAGHVIAEPEDDARYVFDQSSLRTYNISVAEADLALIDMDPAAETFVNATLDFEGKTIGPVSVRYKGSVGGFLPPCTGAAPAPAGDPAAPMSRSRPKTGKCSIKVDFNRVDPELRFYGLKKLNFHSMDRDKSLMRDRLGYSMFRESGVAAPRATHARLLINGKLEGLYVVVEQIDGRFTDSHFSDGGDGNLYKEVWPVSDAPEPYLAALETNNDMPEAMQVARMQSFHAAISAGADASFRWLDTPYLFNYIAVDRVIANDDGAFHWYCQWNHNYYWYEAERADRMWIIPWDLDSSFQNGAFVHINTPWNAATPGMDCTCGRAGGQRPASCDPLTSHWASRTEDYQRAVDSFLAGPFSDANVSAKLLAWTQQVDAAVQEAAGVQGAPSYAEWQEAFANLQAIIASSRVHRGYAYEMPVMMP